MSMRCHFILLTPASYYDFFASTLNTTVGSNFNLKNIALPLGISFYTFQQIGFLVDSYTGKQEKSSFVEYALFVTFFPQLVAGPIVKYSEVIPQFRKETSCRIDWNNLSWGFIILSFGLAKKVLLADTLALGVNWYWSNLESASGLDTVFAMLMYTLEIYFDFSGYCDMAYGMALILNIELPINFNKPYIATSITDFWSRWHMTLTRFLREYIYIPLGGNRKGKLRTYLNVMIVFLVSGLWHGANWTFVLWGGMHGTAQVIERAFKKSLGKIPKIVTGVVTFLFVNLAWMLFRAPTITDACVAYTKFFEGSWTVSSNMLLNYYIVEFIPLQHTLFRSNPYLYSMITVIVIGLVFSFFFKPVIQKQGKIVPRLYVAGALFIWSVINLSVGGTFIYFNF